MGLVYFGSWDGHVYALDVVSGTLVWRFDTGGIVQGAPAVGAGMVFAGSRSAAVFAQDARTGELVWKLVLEDGSTSFKAVSPDEAMVWVRKFGDPHGGDLSFGAEVLKKDFLANRGYTLIEEGETTDATGREGKEFVFEMTVGTAHRYLIAVFVIEGWFANTICAVEFVAPKAVFEEHLGEVREAIGTLEP